MGKSEDATYEQLKSARDAFNGYFDAGLKAALGLSDDELERMDLAQIGQRIQDPAVRGQYRDKAIAMLEANISHYSPNARRRSDPQIKRTFAVASTFFVSAFAYKFAEGIFPALLIAGVWYWLAAEDSDRRHKDLVEEIQQHNGEVAEWATTIEDWNAEIDDLRKLR